MIYSSGSISTVHLGMTTAFMGSSQPSSREPLYSLSFLVSNRASFLLFVRFLRFWLVYESRIVNYLLWFLSPLSVVLLLNSSWNIMSAINLLEIWFIDTLRLLKSPRHTYAEITRGWTETANFIFILPSNFLKGNQKFRKFIDNFLSIENTLTYSFSFQKDR